MSMQWIQEAEIPSFGPPKQINPGCNFATGC